MREREIDAGSMRGCGIGVAHSQQRTVSITHRQYYEVLDTSANESCIYELLKGIRDMPTHPSADKWTSRSFTDLDEIYP